MSGFDPDAFLAQPTEAPQPQAANQADTSGFDPDAFLKQQNANDYSSTGQKIKAGAEGVAEGILGPIAPFAEKRYLGVDPEDIRGREEAHPYIHGAGEVAGLLSPIGEGAALEKAGQFAVEKAGLGGVKASKEIIKDAVKLGMSPQEAKAAFDTMSLGSKVGASSIKAATEMGLFQGGDEISKMIKEDPNSSAQNAIANIGLSAALGGVGGGVLGVVSPLWKATAGSKIGQILEDLKGETKFLMDNPDMTSAVSRELDNHYQNTTKAFDDTWGYNGMKAQAIEKLAPQINDKIVGQTNSFLENAQKTLQEMKQDPVTYPGHLTNKFERMIQRFGTEAAPANSSGDMFQATNTFKQGLQDLSRFDRPIKIADPEYEFVNKMKGIGSDIRKGLEDPGVWGRAGDVQGKINAAASKFFTPLKEFNTAFTEIVNGERKISPGKINTFVNQLSSPKAEIKTEKLTNFLKASENFKRELSNVHEAAGIENPMEDSSLAVVNRLLKTPTFGSKLANKIIDHGLASAAGATVGGMAGGSIGHIGLGAIIGEHALSPIFKSVFPGIIKSLLENKTSPEGYKAALDYGMNVAKGELSLSKAAKNIFKPGAEVITAKALPDEKDRQKLDKIVSNTQSNPQKLLDAQNNSHIGHYLGDHQTAITQTSTQAIQYLQQLKPQPYKPGPLDKPIEPSKLQEARYNRALDIAQNPQVVLQHVKDGTLQISDLQDLKSMYPSYYNNISQKLTNEMMSKESEEEHIPYKTRIGVSMFLGQPMDSSMNPMSIMAAQPVPKASPPQPEAQKKGSPSKMKDKSAKAYETSTQSAEADRSGRKA